jgi:transcriptional regulator with XRE-family HTH domain
MGKRSIAIAGTISAPPGCSVPHFVQVTPKEEFSAVILDLRLNQDLSRKAIGKIAGVGSETVKAWERGRQMGQFEHIARLSQSIKSVRQFALRQLGATHSDLDFLSPQVVTAMVAAFHQVAHQPGPDGDAVREALAKMGKRNG